MKPILAVSLLALALAACGSASDEDVLTPDKIRASESAPELPDVQLSDNPEPPPAPPTPEQPALNELGNDLLDNSVTADPLAPVDGAGIPAAFQDRWGQRPADCGDGDVIGRGLIVSSDSLMSGESVGTLVTVISSGGGSFTGLFEFDGQQREERLALGSGGNVLLRNGVPYRRCSTAAPTG